MPSFSGSITGFTIQAIYGGVDYMKQRDALKEGTDVVIGTPGRLIDYLKQKVYSLKNIEVLVIDEADRMFDMGFITDLRFILRRLPPYDQRQNMMFSATLNQRVMELAYEFMNAPEKVSVTPEQMTAERVTQLLYHVARKEKFPLLLGLLRKEGMERTMIFVNTKREAEFLHDRLKGNGFPCRVISGDVEQKKRLKILDDFKSGRLPIMIGTDVASRGLHIEEGLPCHQLRSPPGSRGLRPPDRPHRPRRRRGEGNIVRRRGRRLLPGGDRSVRQAENPHGMGRG